MKDAFGHGSNAHEGSLNSVLRARLSHVTSLKGAPSGGVAMTSNAAAGAALASTLKATQAPVHDAMRNAVSEAGAGLSQVAGFFSNNAGAFDQVKNEMRSGPRGSRSFGSVPITNLKGVHR